MFKVDLPGPYVHMPYGPYAATMCTQHPPMFVILKLKGFIDTLSIIPNGYTNKLANIKPVTKA